MTLRWGTTTSCDTPMPGARLPQHASPRPQGGVSLTGPPRPFGSCMPRTGGRCSTCDSSWVSLTVGLSDLWHIRSAQPHRQGPRPAGQDSTQNARCTASSPSPAGNRDAQPRLGAAESRPRGAGLAAGPRPSLAPRPPRRVSGHFRGATRSRASGALHRVPCPEMPSHVFCVWGIPVLHCPSSVTGLIVPARCRLEPPAHLLWATRIHHTCTPSHARSRPPRGRDGAGLTGGVAGSLTEVGSTSPLLPLDWTVARSLTDCCAVVSPRDAVNESTWQGGDAEGTPEGRRVSPPPRRPHLRTRRPSQDTVGLPRFCTPGPRSRNPGPRTSEACSGRRETRRKRVGSTVKVVTRSGPRRPLLGTPPKDADGGIEGCRLRRPSAVLAASAAFPKGFRAAQTRAGDADDALSREAPSAGY